MSDQEFPRERQRELGERRLDKVMNRWNDFEDRDRGLKEKIEAYVCRFEEVFRELEVVGGMMLTPKAKAMMLLKRSGMEKLEKVEIMRTLDKVKEEALYEQMKTQIIQVSTRTPVKKKGKRIAKESETGESKYDEEHRNSLGLEGDTTADHTNTKIQGEAKDITDEEKTDERNLIVHEKSRI